MGEFIFVFKQCLKAACVSKSCLALPRSDSGIWAGAILLRLQDNGLEAFIPLSRPVLGSSTMPAVQRFNVCIKLLHKLIYMLREETGRRYAQDMEKHV